MQDWFRVLQKNRICCRYDCPDRIMQNRSAALLDVAEQAGRGGIFVVLLILLGALIATRAQTLPPLSERVAVEAANQANTALALQEIRDELKVVQKMQAQQGEDIANIKGLGGGGIGVIALLNGFLVLLAFGRRKNEQ
jgi:hypothetical protein